VKYFLAPSTQQKRTDAVGVVIAVDRIVAALLAHDKREPIKMPHTTDIVIFAAGNKLMEERMKIAADLWACNISVEFQYPEQLSQDHILDVCKGRGIPWLILLRNKGIQSGTVRVVNVETKKQLDVPRHALTSHFAFLSRSKKPGSHKHTENADATALESEAYHHTPKHNVASTSINVTVLSPMYEKSYV